MEPLPAVVAADHSRVSAVWLLADAEQPVLILLILGPIGPIPILILNIHVLIILDAVGSAPRKPWPALAPAGLRPLEATWGGDRFFSLGALRGGGVGADPAQLSSAPPAFVHEQVNEPTRTSKGNYQSCLAQGAFEQALHLARVWVGNTPSQRLGPTSSQDARR